ncbi:MAG: deoxyguanosinetriphosphate triphosphohydrolase [Atopobiaceae bacterium]|nr:deoxyguanosinetriphosphate triphosphohydrolase [Atopobiaceae bacterium]
MHALCRRDIEQREHTSLSPLASFAEQSAGRLHKETPDSSRTCFQQDRDRILHSKSFRRLAHKTQVFLAPEGDHYRTRLIHTLEVCQISRTVARGLGLNEDLTEAIALGHDLGHTPFGHAGEDALSREMARYRGIDESTDEARSIFRHNEQGVRIVELLERDGQGLNLSREVVDGIRCHSGSERADTLEGRIVAVCDRIAYVSHDIDDAERAGLLTEADLPQAPVERLGQSASERIATMVGDLIENSARVSDIAMSEACWADMMELRTFLFANIYRESDAKYEEPKAKQLIRELFCYYIEHLDEVPSEYRIHNADQPDVQVADFVSGMTDRYAIRLYEQLKVPRAWRLDVHSS